MCTHTYVKNHRTERTYFKRSDIQSFKSVELSHNNTSFIYNDIFIHNGIYEVCVELYHTINYVNYGQNNK